MKLTTERFLFYTFCILTASPLLFSHYPPMIDVPQHAAIIATLNNLSLPEFPFHDLYYIDWIRPYLGGYLVLWGVSQFLPILVAIKLLVALAVIATPLTASLIRAHFGGDPRWDWLLLPIGYGFAFQWGFFNFIIGAPIVLLYLLTAFKYAESPNIKSGLWLALFSFTLLLIHLLVAAFGCGLAFLYVMAGRLQWRQKLLVVLPFVFPFAIIIIYLMLRVSVDEQPYSGGSWGLSIYRPIEFLATAIGLTPSRINAAIGLLILAIPFMLGARITDDRPRQVVFIAFLLWMMFGPNYILGNYFTYNRFSLFTVPMLFVIMTKPSSAPRSVKYEPLLRGLLIVVPVMLIVLLCFRFASFDKESQGYRDIETKMQPQKRVLALIYDNQSATFRLPMYLHFASWYQAERSGATDFSFSQFNLLVRYKPDAAVAVPPRFEWQPETFDWKTNKGWLYDYFLVRSQNGIDSKVIETAGCDVNYVAKSGFWWLYEVELGDIDDPASCAAKRVAEIKRQ